MQCKNTLVYVLLAYENISYGPSSFQVGDAQTQQDQLISANILLLFLSWASPCCFYSVCVVSETG